MYQRQDECVLNKSNNQALHLRPSLARVVHLCRVLALHCLRTAEAASCRLRAPAGGILTVSCLCRWTSAWLRSCFPGGLSGGVGWGPAQGVLAVPGGGDGDPVRRESCAHPSCAASGSCRQPSKSVQVSGEPEGLLCARRPAQWVQSGAPVGRRGLPSGAAVLCRGTRWIRLLG